MTATLTIDNVAPIYLNVLSTTAGLRVFYDTTEVDVLLDDVFPETTALTNVAVHVHNGTTSTIYVTFNKKLPAIEVHVDGSTSRTLLMPDPDACNSMSITVSNESGSHDPIIRLKRKLGNVTPTCGTSTSAA
jgi:hypothetical protein